MKKHHNMLTRWWAFLSQKKTYATGKDSTKTKQRTTAFLVAMVLSLGWAAAVAPRAFASAGPYRIINEAGYCLQVPNGSMSWGEQLTLGECGPTPTWYQLFYFDYAGGAKNYFIRPAHSMYCLVPGNVFLFSSTIVQWGCNWYDQAQVWNLDWVQGPEGTFMAIKNTSSGWYLTTVEDPVPGSYVRQGNYIPNGHWYRIPWL